MMARDNASQNMGTAVASIVVCHFTRFIPDSLQHPDPFHASDVTVEICTLSGLRNARRLSVRLTW